MAEVTIYGASDDLVEIEGDFAEEFNPADDPGMWLVFGDGTVVSVRYGEEGIWRVTRVAEGSAEFVKDEAISDDGTREDGRPAYSDVVTLRGDLRWCVAAERFTFARIPEVAR